jgi:AbrB family looped-hinge helix DNA binding protein
MPLVTVKPKFQVTIPTSVRKQTGVGMGDLLEAKVERGKITLTPKSLIDRELALALEACKEGILAFMRFRHTERSRQQVSSAPLHIQKAIDPSSGSLASSSRVRLGHF